MKTTRTYLSGCTWCGATGIVPNLMIKGSSVTALLTMTCPVCNGAKTIPITETIEDNLTMDQFKEINNPK
jgi:hypothetical protein